MENILVVTNSQNNYLLNKSYSTYKSLFDNTNYKFVCIDGKNHLYGYHLFDYLFSKYFVDTSWDYMLYIDEDMFISDINELYHLIDFFIENNYTYCGVPDGGVINHRFHNPLCINTFISLWNIKDIRKVYDSKIIASVKYDKKKDGDIFQNKQLSDIIDKHQNEKVNNWDSPNVHYEKINYDDFEPYYKIFLFLNRNGAIPYYLDANNSFNEHDILTSEVLNYNGNVIGYHTWMAREYGKSLDQTSRINKILNKLNLM